MRSAPIVRAGGLGFRAVPGATGVVYERDEVVDLAAAYAARVPAPSAAELSLLEPRMAGAVLPGAHVVTVLDIEAVSVAPGHLAAFLVGTGTWRGDTLELRQWLLADPAAEAALLEAVSAQVRGSLLLTYNGRAFDMRVLGSRCVANGIHPAAVEPRFHIDLLAPARRQHRSDGACSLRALEQRVLGFDRGDDVPGNEGPARYRAWLRGATPDVLAGVVRHNALDVCGTAALAARLVSEWALLARAAAPQRRQRARPSQHSVR